MKDPSIPNATDPKLAWSIHTGGELSLALNTLEVERRSSTRLRPVPTES